MSLVKDLKAYKGANTPLYIVHALNNLDKHRLLVTAGIAIFKATGSPPSVLLEDGAEVYRIPAFLINTYGKDEDLQQTFDVALHEPGILPSEPLISCLHQLTQFVEVLIKNFFRALPELNR